MTETSNRIGAEVARDMMREMGFHGGSRDSDRQRGYRAACAAKRRAVDDDELAALAGDPPIGTINPDEVDGFTDLSDDADKMAAGAAAARLVLGKK